MTAPKTAGSLTAGLLARKGAAQPAMRRQPVTGLSPNFGSGSGPRAVTPLDDLGWNDMGEDQTPSPVAAHIAAIQDTLDRRHAEPVAAAAASAPAPRTAEPRPAPVTRKKGVARPDAHKGAAKSAFTLRIDAERHLRLRLLSAVTNRSAQQLLTGALDALIAQHPEIDALAANPKLRRSSSQTGVE